MISGERHRSLGDPSFIGKRGKTASRRLGRYDAPVGATGSERRLKAKLMRQFIKGYDGPRGNSPEYLNSACWCWCGRLNGTHAHGDAR